MIFDKFGNGLIAGTLSYDGIRRSRRGYQEEDVRTRYRSHLAGWNRLRWNRKQLDGMFSAAMGQTQLPPLGRRCHRLFCFYFETCSLFSLWSIEVVIQTRIDDQVTFKNLLEIVLRSVDASTASVPCLYWSFFYDRKTTRSLIKRHHYCRARSQFYRWVAARDSSMISRGIH